MADDSLPAPDRIDGVPHPCETLRLFGQDRAAAAFTEAYDTGRLHSGWLISGPRGVGKATLAYKIAGFLLSEPVADQGLFAAEAAPRHGLDIGPDHPDMRLIRAGSHPRLCVVRRPVDDKTGKLRSEITAEPVRALKRFFQMSAADGGRRVVIVDTADEMNVTAANAILKELEEPPLRTTLLLLSHQPSGLLPTIRSRCRELRCDTLGAADLGAALAQAGMKVDDPERLGILAAGSCGQAARLVALNGPELYARVIQLVSRMPHTDRSAMLSLAESCTGIAGQGRFETLWDMLEFFLIRAARCGVGGVETVTPEACEGEAAVLARLAPDMTAGRAWADLHFALGARIRHGKAVNLDPSALIIDTVLKIEDTARNTRINGA